MNRARTIASRLLLAAGLLLPAGPAVAAPLTAAERQAFEVTERDPVKPIKGPSYFRSNETELQHFFPHLRGLGGGYVGVGADQNYTLAAVAKSQLVWLMDYDPMVYRLHLIYRALILEAASPQDFLQLWRDKKRVKALLRRVYRGHAELARLLWIHRRIRLFMARYHRWSIKRRRNGQPATWLANPVWYDYVRRMWREGRFQPLHGDLHGTKAFQGICAAARRLKVPMRIVYLSNAEMYVRYTPSFRANMRAVPWGPKSLLVRTVRSPKLPMQKRDRWHYNVQPYGNDYLRRLANRRYYNIYDMMADFRRSSRKVRRATGYRRAASRFTPAVLDMKAWRKRRLKRRRIRRVRRRAAL